MRQLQIGLFLGLRQIQRASVWSTVLIVTIIIFTFLNLVTLRGLLLGIVDGAQASARSESFGDINFAPLDTETRILQTERIKEMLGEYPEIEAFSTRYSGLATIEANYQERWDFSADPDVIAVNITGVDPAAEDATTHMHTLIQEGGFLEPGDSGYIVLGKYHIDRYAAEYGDVFDSLKGIQVGDKVLVSVGGESREFIVKGVIDSKIDLVSVMAYISEVDFRRMFSRDDHNANSVVVRLRPGEDETVVRDRLRAAGMSQWAEVDGFNDDVPKFIIDVRDTFERLSWIVGATGLVVAAITIFIVVFINALSRRRQIGILKAIGITRRSIEFAYMIQAAVYAIVGSLVGVLVTQFLIIPYFAANPIDFPYSDVSLSVQSIELWLLCGAFLVVSMISGYLPASLITRQNTLDTILGRK